MNHKGNSTLEHHPVICYSAQIKIDDLQQTWMSTEIYGIILVVHNPDFYKSANGF